MAKDFREAVDCVAAIHTTVARMLVAIAKNVPLSELDKHQIRFMPETARVLLRCCEAEERTSRLPLAPSEGITTWALCALQKKTTELLTDVATLPTHLIFEMMRPGLPGEIHSLTVDLCKSLHLVPR